MTQKELRVDANCGWSVKQAIRMLPVLEEFGVTVLEQPLAAEDLEGLGKVSRASRIPVIADESCKTAADIPRWLAKWTASISSWPSAAASGKRCA